MIELLKEKRQAIITKAVTKGLDPNMPMKDSGVEWIGEIPEHWDTIPIKFIMSCNDETLPESTHPETKIQYIEISDVSENQGITSIQEIKFSDAPSRARRIVKDGDIIISTVRTYLRAIATIKEPRENTVVSTGFAVLRSRGLSQKFAKYALSANYFIERIVSESTGVSYPAISSEKLMNFRIAIPDSKSQNYISDYIDKINGKLSQLISKQERMIELLKEYKTSLITQAVTGKIDVRGFAFPTDSKSA
jgi:type I restriction enzyme S subunit